MKYTTAKERAWNVRARALDEQIANLQTKAAHGDITDPERVDLATLRTKRSDMERTHPATIAAGRRRSGY